MSEEEEKVDWDAALVTANGQMTLLKELIEIFEGECPQLLNDIEVALEADDAQALAMNAHRLKGSLRYFGPSVAVRRSEELEFLGRDAQMEEVRAKFAEVRTAVQRLLALLREGPE